MSQSTSPVFQRLFWRLCLAGSMAVLTACGGTDRPVAAPPVQPPPPAVGNQAPVGAFTAADSVDAGTPLALDASASSDADGDALLYHWDFGDGTLGGGRQIAHVFSVGGSYSVRLTVDDGRGGSARVDRTVTVTAARAPVALVDTQARVRALDGTALPGVAVSWVGGTASAVTDASGRATLRTGTGVASMLKFSKSGYADQFRDAGLPAGAESGFVEVSMLAREPALTLADAAAGGTLSGKDGARVSFARGSLIDAAGQPVVGAVSVSMTPVDVAAHVRAFPGRFSGVRSNGASGLLMSYGAVEFVLEAAGQPVQLAPGSTASIDIPVYTRVHRDGRAMAVGDSSPLWSLDERSGDWVEEGSGVVVAADTPSGFALRAQVQHFSWWNHDDFVNPPGGPKPKCVVDTNLDGEPEDLTGTGYCWHAGTGPEQDERKQSASVRALEADPRTSRFPAFAVWAATPAAGGVVLPIPPDTDVTFRSYAKNGTLFGTRVVRLGPNVEQDVEILLSPVQSIDAPTAITLPYDNTLMMAVQNDVDRFTFNAEANASYDIVIVAAGLGSSFSGQFSVLGANGAALANGSFGTTAVTTTVLAAAAGVMTIDVSAARGTPGAYRIQVRKVETAGCAANAALALPGSTGNIAIAANAQRCFDLALAADDVVQITATGRGSIANRLAVFSSTGVQLASTPFADTAGAPDGVLRLAVARADTLRVVLTNPRNFAGSVSNLSVSRIALAGTLNAPASIGFASASTGADNARFYLVKPGSAEPLAAALTVSGANHIMRLWPQGTVVSTAFSTVARLLDPGPGLLPLIEVLRRDTASAWNFTLAASHPPALPLNADVAASTPPPDGLTVWRIDGLAGQQLSIGKSQPRGANISPVLRLYAPNLDGELLAGDADGIYTLPTHGAYTLTLSNPTTAGVSFTLRVNELLDPEFVSLGTLFERSGTLALGEVKRYSFSIALAQMLALRLSSSGTLEATAYIRGGNIRQARPLSLVPGAKSVSSPALYVREAGVGTLVLLGTSRGDGSSSGPFSLQLQSPTATPARLGELIVTAVQGNVLQTHAFDIGTAGKHLLCTTYADSGADRLVSIVWGPSAPAGTAWDLGDIATRSPDSSGPLVKDVGDLRVGRNTLSLLSPAPSATATTQRLVALPLPTDIAVGGSSGPLSLASCERRYLRFAGSAGTAYTLRVTAGFAGRVYIRRQSAFGDWSSRTATLGGTPLALTAGTERVVNFTIPPLSRGFGDGTYVIEVDTDGEATGQVTASLSSP